VTSELPVVYLARHGETAWSLAGQHTGLTDLPLTARGEINATQLGTRLAALHFDTVLTSPLQRAFRTCQLAGFSNRAQVDRDLVEWDYGKYEGLRTDEILAKNPNWQLFTEGCPGGELPQDVGTRADRVIEKVRTVQGNVLLFSSGHILRVLAARWIKLGPEAGMKIVLSTASLSALGYERNLTNPVIQQWNDTRHILS
jgi:broad specificity phosphatase PhoE